jgi:hypothetical protein
MRILIVSLFLSLFLVLPVHAKEAEPDLLPNWVTPKCLYTVAVITQHEVGNTHSEEIIRFVAYQVLQDAKSMGCGNLTQWRWAIRSFPKPSQEVMNIVASYPTGYKKCRFVGSLSDTHVWRSHGYTARIDYRFDARGFTVVGADCLTAPAPRIDQIAVLDMP